MSMLKATAGLGGRPGQSGVLFRAVTLVVLFAVVVLASEFAQPVSAQEIQAQGTSTTENGGDAATLFSDVPRSHWAYDAVSRLVEEGLLTGYGDGRFQGDQPLTRYEFAILTARLLDRLPRLTLSATEKQLIARLSGEFAPEIRRIQDMLGALENRIRDNEGGVSRLEKELSAYSDELDRLRVDLGEVAKNSAVGAKGWDGSDGDDPARLAKRIAYLEERLGAAEGTIRRLSVAVGVLAVAVGVAIYIAVTH